MITSLGRCSTGPRAWPTVIALAFQSPPPRYDNSSGEINSNAAWVKDSYVGACKSKVQQTFKASSSSDDLYTVIPASAEPPKTDVTRITNAYVDPCVR